MYKLYCTYMYIIIITCSTTCALINTTMAPYVIEHVTWSKSVFINKIVDGAYFTDVRGNTPIVTIRDLFSKIVCFRIYVKRNEYEIISLKNLFYRQ